MCCCCCRCCCQLLLLLLLLPAAAASCCCQLLLPAVAAASATAGACVNGTVAGKGGWVGCNMWVGAVQLAAMLPEGFMRVA